MKLTTLQRILLFVAAALLGSSIFVAIWRIELEAPQYPEGLNLLIYANKLGGNVDIINGLNHYIGMQTLHAENFIEFTILPYIIGFFTAFSLLAAILANKKVANILFFSFVAFGIIAMIDFYRWNYNYGHNLDPNAAIIVPGMAYQPPLIGYKQLLNFGAFSTPDIGGWFFITAGLFMLTVFVTGTKLWDKKFTKNIVSLVVFGFISMLTSCSTDGPKQPKLHHTNCDFCKMTIANEKFIAQCVTDKGRVYYFDDIACMVRFKSENITIAFANFYIADFNNPAKYLKGSEAFLFKNEEIKSPMGGNIIAFSKQTDAEEFLQKHAATKVSWTELNK